MSFIVLFLLWFAQESIKDRALHLLVMFLQSLQSRTVPWIFHFMVSIFFKSANQLFYKNFLKPFCSFFQIWYILMNSLHSTLYHASLSSTYFKEQRNSRNTNTYNISYIMPTSKPKNGVILGAVPSKTHSKGSHSLNFPRIIWIPCNYIDTYSA